MDEGSGRKMESGTFSIAEYKRDIRRVMAHAETHGSAIVVDETGRTEFVVNVPQENLPGFEDAD